MTLNEFEETRIIIIWYASEWGKQLTDKIKIGQNWQNLFFKLYVLQRYIDILIEYTPQTLSEYNIENINFFTVEEMVQIQERINELINTDFALTFILD